MRRNTKDKNTQEVTKGRQKKKQKKHETQKMEKAVKAKGNKGL